MLDIHLPAHHICLRTPVAGLFTKTVSTVDTWATFFFSSSIRINPVPFLNHVWLQWDLSIWPSCCWCCCLLSYLQNFINLITKCLMNENCLINPTLHWKCWLHKHKHKSYLFLRKSCHNYIKTQTIIELKHKYCQRSHFLLTSCIICIHCTDK